MRSRAVILVSVVLTAFSLWIAAAPMIGRVFSPGRTQAGSSDLVQDTPSQSVDLGPVLDFAPFGRAEGMQTEELPEAGTDTGLILLGITDAQTEAQSRAIIAGGDGQPANYGIGDTIATDVTLRRVLGDHVVLQIGGQDQPLFFPQAEGLEPEMMVVAVPALAAHQEASQAATMLGRYRAEIRQDPGAVLDRLGLTPTDRGYLVTDAATAEVRQAGLQPGDLIGGVNGQPLGDLDQDPARLDEVAALGRATLSVLRDGKTILMTFPLQ